MTENSHFMGQDGFIWFVGVVEDRNDPSALGRVRVRCLGYHTADLTDLPTTDLPWAHVMHPVTDPCMHGMGNSPSFLVEGSYVVGFFRDPEKQQLVIMGTLPGVPEVGADPSKGFNDPRGKNSKQESFKGDPVYGPYPVDGENYFMTSDHELGEPDTNRLAQGKTSETHTSLIARREQRLSGDPSSSGTGIPTATQPYLKAVSDEAVQETRGYFEEPNPKGITSTAEPYTSGQYPFNHVFESESGHIREIDDSPGAERLFTQHMKGTFEEIHPDGTKVVKVIGDNYEIIAGTSNIFISATENSGDALNLTVNGNVRELIKGDYHLEVEGNYTQKIHKNLRTKIGAGDGGGNLEEEIIGNHGFVVKGKVNGKVGPEGQAAPGEGDYKLQIVGDETHLVGKKIKMASEDSSVYNANTNMIVSAKDNLSISTASGIVSVKSGDKIDIRAKTSMKVNPETSLTTTVGTTWVSTTGSTWTHTSGGDISITGGPNIKLNPS